MPQTLLITGGTGYLGHHLIQHAHFSNIHATCFRTPPPPSTLATFHPCDLKEKRQVQQLITSVQPDVIIHTACSNKSPEEIEAIVPAARYLASHAHDQGVKLIHLSTDLVFDGTAAPYREEDLPSPLHPYGQAKVAAEQLITTICPTAVIIRTSLMYGINPLDHQTRWLKEGVDTDNPIRLFTDEIRSPIWVRNLADMLLELTTVDVQGILHLAGPEGINRWDFGLAILRLLGCEPSLNIRPSTIEESELIRPKNLTFTIDKAQNLLHTPLLSISDVTQQLQETSS